MFSLIARNLFFTILQPGAVVFLIPYLLLDDNVFRYFNSGWQMNQFGGAVLFIAGFIVMSICIFSFGVKGCGTLSPADPTTNLVTSGLYRYSRNPMYVGVLMMLAGETVFFLSASLLIYSIIVFIVFTVFVIAVEEPRLRRDFGSEYDAYCTRVGRWMR